MTPYTGYVLPLYWVMWGYPLIFLLVFSEVKCPRGSLPAPALFPLERMSNIGVHPDIGVCPDTGVYAVIYSNPDLGVCPGIGAYEVGVCPDIRVYIDIGVHSDIGLHPGFDQSLFMWGGRIDLGKGGGWE
jgi:hypothetical protein